jgi:CSLREA domain-containing protein
VSTSKEARIQARRTPPAIIGAVLILALMLPASAAANTIQVTTAADDVGGTPASCSLREAILTANADAPAPTNGCAAASGADTITFAPALTDQTIQLGTGAGQHELIVSGPLSIVGPGIDHLTVSGANDRVIETTGGASLSLSGLDVENGARSESDVALGGGIRASGSLSLTSVRVAGNTVTGTATSTDGTAEGGGIYAQGPLTLTDSVIANNKADAENPLATTGEAVASGGGAQADGGATVTDTTFDTNTATATDSHGTGVGNDARSTGGGMAATSLTMSGSTTTNDLSVASSPEYAAFADGAGLSASGSVSIVNSTIADNFTEPSGASAPQSIQDGAGMIAKGGTVSIWSATIAYNGPNTGTGTGANLAPHGNTVNLRNSIVSNPRGSGSTNCDGPVVSGGFNIDSGATCLVSPAGGDQPNTDAHVGSLGMNGGLTQTKLMPPNSAAIDQGNTSGQPDPGHDQRGLPRQVDSPTIANAPGGNGSDVGAVEAQPPPPPTLSSTSPTSPSTTNFTPLVLGGTVNWPWEDGATGVTIYSNPACTSSLGSGTPAAFASPGIQVTVPQNATTALYATDTNAWGIPSACSSTLSAGGSLSYTQGTPVAVSDPPTTTSTPTTTTPALDPAPAPTRAVRCRKAKRRSAARKCRKKSLVGKR